MSNAEMILIGAGVIIPLVWCVEQVIDLMKRIDRLEQRKAPR
jgi:hypothetical protein